MEIKLQACSFELKELAYQESIFHTANGYIGVRGCFEEGVPDDITTIRGCYINGVYNISDMSHPEALYGFPQKTQRIINLPDIQTIRLKINDEMFSLYSGKVISYSREFNLKQGISLRRIYWESPKGDELLITINRIASFTNKNLFLIDYKVECLNNDASIQIESELNGDINNFSDPLDPRVAAKNMQYLDIIKAHANNNSGYLECKTKESNITVITAVDHVFSEQIVIQRKCTEKSIKIIANSLLKKGVPFIMKKFCCMIDSRHSEAPIETAKIILNDAISNFRLYNDQQKYLDDFWKISRVIIRGNDKDQSAVDFCLYGLLQSAGTDGISNIASKGLSGEGYEGHYFWDTEIYMLPFFINTQPNIAKRLLEYRYSILPYAKKHARLLGHRQGALYPWRTISGSECSGYYPSGSAQYHINGDIAYSFLQYYYVTGDIAFIAEKGAEVIFETARLWMDVGHYNESGQFCIDSVTGPDEYTCIINNNYYTNICAKYNLLGAVEIFELLNNSDFAAPIEKIGLYENEVLDFKKAAENMMLLYDAKKDITPQDDSFLSKAIWDFEKTPKEHYPLLLHYHPLYLYRHQVCKQADVVLAHFLYGDGVKARTMQNSLEYYEKITTHDSSLSISIFGAMYARLGYISKAYQCFQNTINTDLDNMHHNSRDGIHAANMGGAYLLIVFGLAGIQFLSERIRIAPRLPADWEEYCFTINYRGSLLHFKITSEGMNIDKEDDSLVNVEYSGELHRLTVKTNFALLPNKG